MHRAISSVSSRGNGVAAAQLRATGRWPLWKKLQGDVRSHRKRERLDGGQCSPSSRISEGLLVHMIVRFLNGVLSLAALNQQKSRARGVAPNPPWSRGAVNLACTIGWSLSLPVCGFSTVNKNFSLRSNCMPISSSILCTIWLPTLHDACSPEIAYFHLGDELLGVVD